MLAVYTNGLGIDLTFQDLDTELACLPGKYSPPLGELLLAVNAEDTGVYGCVALRSYDKPPISDSYQIGVPRCEIKRLYVCPEARGLGIGEALMRAVVRTAITLGYHEALMDTLPTMTSAVRMYERLGFTEAAPYYYSPIAGMKFYCSPLVGEKRLFP